MAKWQDTAGEVCEHCAVFYRVREEFGGLSNMAGGYPLVVGDVTVPSSEALYQACRFPHEPAWQREIIAEANPMRAKMVARKGGRRRLHSRSDWNEVQVFVMEWVLRVKLAQHFKAFGNLLRSTGNRAIVEKSRRDAFWGAKEGADGTLHGENRLGRLLMRLRDGLIQGTITERQEVSPPEVKTFLLLGEPIGSIRAT